MINRVVLVGRLTKDVEVRKTQSGISFTRFTLACDRRVSRDSNQPTADFISCLAWDQRADFLGQYAKKGNVVAVDGRIQTGSYDRNGQRVYTTDVVADTVRLIQDRSKTSTNITEDSMPKDDHFSVPSADSTDMGQDNNFDDGGFDLSTDDLPF